MVGLFYLKFTALLVIVRLLLIALVILLFLAHLEEAFMHREVLLMLSHRYESLISASLLVILLARRIDLLF